MKAYKGFDPDMKCRGMQYVEGETYTQDGPAKLCDTGFHATLMPLHVLQYYPASRSVFHEVEVDEVDGPRGDDDTKVAGRVIKIGARLTLPALIQAQVDFVFSQSKKVAGATSKKANAQVGTDVEHGAATASGYSGAATASGYSGAATASGYSGAATASGHYGAATASGYSGAATASGHSGAATASGHYGAATASGDYGAATASGDYGAATASGYSGAATASGYSGAATASGHSGAATASGHYGAATASGHSGAATASGHYGAATASGYSGAATASGEKTAAMASGKDGRARGIIGTALFLTERDADWNIVNVAAVIVDGKKILADTYYTLRAGKVVAA
jgi:hypothetical protein